MHQDLCGCKSCFKLLEGYFLFGSPFPWDILLSETIQWCSQGGQVRNEPAVVVDHAQNDPNCPTLVGAGASKRASTFFCTGLIPFLSMIWPRYLALSLKNAHFSFRPRSPCFSNRASTSLRCFRCSSSVLPVTSMSSMYHTTPSSPCRTWSMVPWNMAGLEATPYGRRHQR